MKKIGLIVAGFAVLWIFSADLEASIWGSHLTFDGLEDEMIDDSVAHFLDPDSNGLDVGDTVYGFVSVSDFTVTGNPAPDEIALLFAFDVAATTASQDGTSYFTHSAPSGGLGSFVDSAFAPVVSITTPGGATTSDATVVVVANTGTDDPMSPPIDIAAPGDLTGFIPADGWTYQATLGFDPGSTDFLHIETSGSARSERGGFTFFDHNFGGSIPFLGVTVERFGEDDGASPFPPTSTHDAIIEGTVESTAGDPAFTDSSNMRLNPVPEPAAFVIWGLLAAFASVFAWRRRVSG